MAKKTADNDLSPPKTGGYPYHLLDSTLKLGEVLKRHGGRDVPKSVIGQELGLGPAGVYQLVSSAKSFGISEGSRDLSLTDAGHDYFFPTSAGSERQALLSFISNPPVFKALISQYDGNRL